MTNKLRRRTRYKRGWISALMLLSTAGTAAAAQDLQWQPVPPLPILPDDATEDVVDKPLVWEAVPETPQQSSFVTAPQSLTGMASSPLPSSTLVWEAVPPSDDASTNAFTARLSDQDSSGNGNSILVWKPVYSDDVITAEEFTTSTPVGQTTEQAIAIARNAIDQQAATFANDRALWRNERWYPQISNDVPVGFGPTGIMTTFGFKAIDCTDSGVCRGTSDWSDYRDQLSDFGEAQFDLTIGAGDSQRFFGLVATASFEETRIPLGDRNVTSDQKKDLLDNYYIGFHITRNLGIDTAIRLGVENWIDVKTCGLSCGFPKSAYGVISQRIRLKSDQSSWFANAYLTLGAGNGEFRSVEDKFRASITAQRDAGCGTFGYRPDEPCSEDTRRSAVLSAANYGDLAPIGSAALEVYPGVNLIGEWSQGNLNAGLSVRPFSDVGFVLTGMWNTLLPNCDYGCSISVNGVQAEIDDNLTTQRSKFSFVASLDLKF